MTAIATLLGHRTVPAGPAVATGAAPPAGTRADGHACAPTCVTDLRPGERALVVGFGEALAGRTARRLLDLGFVPGARVEFVRRAPMADPVILRVADYDIALRREQARHIRVTPA